MLVCIAITETLTLTRLIVVGVHFLRVIVAVISLTLMGVIVSLNWRILQTVLLCSLRILTIKVKKVSVWFS